MASQTLRDKLIPAGRANKSSVPSPYPCCAMVSLAIEVQDLSKVHTMMVVPSPRRVPTAKEMAAFVSRLAPIEMATPSISMVSHPPLPLKTIKEEPSPPKHLSFQGWLIPLAYTGCALVLCLCNILAPDAIVMCAHVLCPVWTLALAAQAVASFDPVWAWLGVLTGILLPFVLLVREPLFVCFYLIVFASFASGRFWHTLQGPAFILCCVCWFGLATGCILAVLADHPRAQISVASFFALSAAGISSVARLGKTVVRFGS